jgi:hypothetical protein
MTKAAFLGENRLIIIIIIIIFISALAQEPYGQLQGSEGTQNKIHKITARRRKHLEKRE